MGSYNAAELERNWNTEAFQYIAIFLLHNFRLSACEPSAPPFRLFLIHARWLYVCAAFGLWSYFFPLSLLLNQSPVPFNRLYNAFAQRIGFYRPQNTNKPTIQNPFH